MRSIRFAGAVSLGLATALVGCAALPGNDAPIVDSRFGDSVRQMVAAQTAERDPQRAAQGRGGFDGQSAVSAINRHRDSFKAPPPTFTILGIGGSAGGTQ